MFGGDTSFQSYSLGFLRPALGCTLARGLRASLAGGRLLVRDEPAL